MNKQYKLGYTIRLQIQERFFDTPQLDAEITLWRLTQEADNCFYGTPLARLTQYAYSRETPETGMYGIEPMTLPGELFGQLDNAKELLLQGYHWSWSDTTSLTSDDMTCIGNVQVLKFLSKVFEDAEHNHRYNPKVQILNSVWSYLNMFPRLLVCMHLNGARHYNIDGEGYHRLSAVQFTPGMIQGIATDTLIVRQNASLFKVSPNA